MKHMKKLASLLLALVMVFALAAPAFAAQEGNLTDGTITIDNAVTGQEYRIYQILYLESYSTDANGNATGAYAYKANSAWADWLKTQTNYVDIDAQGYVTWVATKDSDTADFAKAALAHAKENGIANDGTVTAVEGQNPSFSALKLGYYLVDSTLGTLCSLDTTNPTVIIKEKNVAPGNEKTVEEDSTGDYGEKNDADIGQTVKFQSTITAQAGAENYVFHDKMSAGLTYGSVTGITLNGTAVDASNYEVKTSELGDDCTFHVVFTQAFCDTLKANDKIVISYTATVNEKAVVGVTGNKNESKLSYGEEGKSETVPSTTTTYTWSFGVFKFYYGTFHEVEIEEPLSLRSKDGLTEIGLAGAKFTLRKDTNGTNPIALVNEGNNVYRVATADDTNTDTEITTDDTGKFTISGLDSGTYYLTETAAPAGYNQLSGPIEVVISDTGAVKYKMSGDTEYTEFDAAADPIIPVENKSGTELPETGGSGTQLYTAAGIALLAGALLYLLHRQRKVRCK